MVRLVSFRSPTSFVRSILTITLVVYCTFSIYLIGSQTVAGGSGGSRNDEELLLKHMKARELLEVRDESVAIQPSSSISPSPISTIRHIETTTKKKTMAPLKHGAVPVLNTGEYQHLKDPGIPLSKSLSDPIPQMSIGKPVKNVDIILGITTIVRENATYLDQTLKSLLKDMDGESVSAQIVVFIGETDPVIVSEMIGNVAGNFSDALHSGLLVVISPPAHYYPDWEASIPDSLDLADRAKWRSKQNLDQIFLMMYSFNLNPKYYLMLEDDVIAAKDYLKQIKRCAEVNRNRDWFFLSFCSLGAIGKLFHSATLPSYASFLHMFWNRKPLDWLQSDYVNIGICTPDDLPQKCHQKMNSRMIKCGNSVFQHIGKQSSLKGKQQLLTDASFRMNASYLHMGGKPNPKLNVHDPNFSYQQAKLANDRRRQHILRPGGPNAGPGGPNIGPGGPYIGPGGPNVGQNPKDLSNFIKQNQLQQANLQGKPVKVQYQKLRRGVPV